VLQALQFALQNAYSANCFGVAATFFSKIAIGFISSYRTCARALNSIRETTYCRAQPTRTPPAPAAAPPKGSLSEQQIDELDCACKIGLKR
jgi:hypothetical protein